MHICILLCITIDYKIKDIKDNSIDYNFTNLTEWTIKSTNQAFDLIDDFLWARSSKRERFRDQPTNIKSTDVKENPILTPLWLCATYW